MQIFFINVNSAKLVISHLFYKLLNIKNFIFKLLNFIAFFLVSFILKILKI